MKNTKQLSRLMKLSWDIQRNRHSTRAKALSAAWAIFTNEDVTVFYLVTKFNHRKPVKPQVLSQIALFPNPENERQ